MLSYLKICITGKRLVLRPYKFSDFKRCRASHLARLDPVNKYDEPIPTPMESDPEKFKARLKHQRSNAKDRKLYIFGLFDKKSQIYIGQIDLFVINEQLRWANIGYHIQNQYFGHGYASEASNLALKAAFKHLNFHRIEAAMELDNKSSQRVAGKIGLRFEGIRKNFFAHNGGIDMKVYATNAIDYQ